MNILLCCAAGMSTSLLVTKMEQAAKDRGLHARIWAVAIDEVGRHIGDADVLLVGPQVRYKLPHFRKEAEARGIPCDVISAVDYGMVNGAKVLDFALQLKK